MGPHKFETLTIATTLKKKAESSKLNWKIVVPATLKSAWGLASVGLNIAISANFIPFADSSALNSLLTELQQNATNLLDELEKNATDLL